MAGFLNKKNRLIDYKLTENGRMQLSSGDIRFKYYTFSDRSINYEAKISNNKIVSDSEFYYLPFEATTDPGIVNNPEYYLSEKLSFEPFNDSFFQLKNTTKPLGETLSNKKYLSTKKVVSNTNANKEIFFENLIEKSEFDFINSTITRRYPTLKYVEENIENLKKVSEDLRFVNHLKNLKLIPVDSNGQEILDSNDDNLNGYKNIEFIFKTLDIKNKISTSDDRESVVCKAIGVIEENKNNIFNLEYKLNTAQITNEDVFSFEVHEVNEENNIFKLPVVNLGSFYDKSKNRSIDVYLIGKFIKKNSIEEIKNFENKTYHYESISNYYFINLFTLVVE